MKPIDGFTSNAVLLHPCGEVAGLLAVEMGDGLGVGIDGGEDAREDLEGQFEAHFGLEPETAVAGIGESQHPEVLGGDAEA